MTCRSADVQQGVGRAQCNVLALLLQVKTAQQIAGRLQAILAAGAQVGERFEIGGECGDGRLDSPEGPTAAPERALCVPRAPRDTCPTALGEAAARTPARPHRDRL